MPSGTIGELIPLPTERILEAFPKLQVTPEGSMLLIKWPECPECLVLRNQVVLLDVNETAPVDSGTRKLVSDLPIYSVEAVMADLREALRLLEKGSDAVFAEPGMFKVIGELLDLKRLSSRLHSAVVELDRMHRLAHGRFLADKHPELRTKSMPSTMPAPRDAAERQEMLSEIDQTP